MLDRRFRFYLMPDTGSGGGGEDTQPEDSGKDDGETEAMRKELDELRKEKAEREKKAEEERQARMSEEEKAKAQMIIERIGLGKIASSSFQELSGGQQQRTLLARSLMATERLLLLDEPVTGLDPQATAELYALIRTLQSDGITIMMVTHDIHPALNDANKVLHFSHNAYFFGDKDEYFRTEQGLKFLKEAGHDHR